MGKEEKEKRKPHPKTENIRKKMRNIGSVWRQSNLRRRRDISPLVNHQTNKIGLATLTNKMNRFQSTLQEYKLSKKQIQ